MSSFDAGGGGKQRKKGGGCEGRLGLEVAAAAVDGCGVQDVCAAVVVAGGAVGGGGLVLGQEFNNDKMDVEVAAAAVDGCGVQDGCAAAAVAVGAVGGGVVAVGQEFGTSPVGAGSGGAGTKRRREEVKVAIESGRFEASSYTQKEIQLAGRLASFTDQEWERLLRSICAERGWKRKQAQLYLQRLAGLDWAMRLDGAHLADLLVEFVEYVEYEQRLTAAGVSRSRRSGFPKMELLEKTLCAARGWKREQARAHLHDLAGLSQLDYVEGKG